MLIPIAYNDFTNLIHLVSHSYPSKSFLALISFVYVRTSPAVSLNCHPHTKFHINHSLHSRVFELVCTFTAAQVTLCCRSLYVFVLIPLVYSVLICPFA